ncbi:hypothetical protein [Flavobacterium lindanitolerans]|nr:hypothetical protein [Flavobacterium lindanitolerans]
MMKKAVHITFLCLFFLLGMRCDAGNKKNLSLTFPETNCTPQLKTCQYGLSKKEFSVVHDTLDKLHKKKKFSNPYRYSMARLSKCHGLTLLFGAVSSSKFVFHTYFALANPFEKHSLFGSFCHKGKLLSIFYPFQAFW